MPSAMTALRWWRSLLRFTLLHRVPTTPAEIPVWGLCVPFLLWHRVVRYDGRTFADDYAAGLPSFARGLARWMYLLFLWFWPLYALLRSLRKGRGARRWYRHALARPDLVVFHLDADYTEPEAAWGRPDHAFGMYYAWDYVRAPKEWYRLDDKQVFFEAAKEAGYPLTPRISIAEALAEGGRFIVKDPQDDLGYGVRFAHASELQSLGDGIVVERILRNHPVLLQSFPEDAPLSSFRVITALDSKTREPRVVRCAIRIGRAGMAVDNTQQGGLWSKVDLRTGAITAGVTKETFGLRDADGPIREGAHPDTGRRFEGLVIPWFDECRRLALDAHRTLAPSAVSLGWDLTLADVPPMFLEVNVWTASYDYDPEDDAFTPACELILEGLQEATA